MFDLFGRKAKRELDEMWAAHREILNDKRRELVKSWNARDTLAEEVQRIGKQLAEQSKANQELREIIESRSEDKLYRGNKEIGKVLALQAKLEMKSGVKHEGTLVMVSDRADVEDMREDGIYVSVHPQVYTGNGEQSFQIFNNSFGKTNEPPEGYASHALAEAAAQGDLTKSKSIAQLTGEMLKERNKKRNAKDAD